MTSHPQPPSGEGKSAGQILRDLRDIGAYALVAVPAVLLFVAVLRLIPSAELSFAERSQLSFFSFVNPETIVLPLAAVLLALAVPPRHPKAQLIVLVALVEYAVVAFFALVFGLLIGLISVAVNVGGRDAFEQLLLRVAWLALFAVPAYAVFRIWLSYFPPAPKPAPQPGVYGQPQYPAPGAQPGRPGYGPVPGQPGGYGPTTYGQAPSWHQPSTFPVPGQSTSAPPTPYGPVAAADATQIVSHPADPAAVQETQVVSAAAVEETQLVSPQVVNEAEVAPAPVNETQVMPPHEQYGEPPKPADNRPGFGPADPDPPRS